MSKPLPNSVIFGLDRTFRHLVWQLMVTELGLDPNTCQFCEVEVPHGCDIHHTKYEGATIFDLRFVCRRCNLQPENMGLA